MPQVLSGPVLTAVKSELPQSHLATVLAVLSALPSPAERPALGHVLRVASQACNHAVSQLAVISPYVAHVNCALQETSVALPDVPVVQGIALMRGQFTRFPAWTCFTQLGMESPDEMLLLAGAELVNALILRRPFRAALAAQITDLIFQESTVGEQQKARRSMRVLAKKLLADISKSSDHRKGDSSSLLLAARVKASMAQQLDVHNLDDRKACGSIRELTHSEMQEAATTLRRRVENGDGTALAIVIAFCCGPSWDTVIDFPFLNHAREDWVARIDANFGNVQIDLTGLIQLAAPRPGYQPASQVHTIPLPIFAADQLRIRVATDPTARCLKVGCCRFSGHLVKVEDETANSPIAAIQSSGQINRMSASDRLC